LVKGQSQRDVLGHRKTGEGRGGGEEPTGLRPCNRAEKGCRLPASDDTFGLSKKPSPGKEDDLKEKGNALFGKLEKDHTKKRHAGTLPPCTESESPRGEEEAEKRKIGSSAMKGAVLEGFKREGKEEGVQESRKTSSKGARPI